MKSPYLLSSILFLWSTIHGFRLVALPACDPDGAFACGPRARGGICCEGDQCRSGSCSGRSDGTCAITGLSCNAACGGPDCEPMGECVGAQQGHCSGDPTEPCIDDSYCDIMRKGRYCLDEVMGHCSFNSGQDCWFDPECEINQCIGSWLGKCL